MHPVVSKKTRSPPFSQREPTVVIHQHLALRAEPASVRTGRRFLHDVLDDRVPTNVAETAVLLGSEAITNAVVHARTSLVLECYSDEDRGELVVEVSDLDASVVLSPVAAAGLRSLLVTPDLNAEGGRGLMLIATLSDRWGISRTTSGKVVWFAFRLDADA